MKLTPRMDQLAPWRAVLAIAACLCSLHATEIELRDGRVLNGEILPSSTAEVIDLRIGDERASLIVHLPRSDIRRLTEGASSEQLRRTELRQAAAAAEQAGDAAALWTAIEGLRAAGETVHARTLADRLCDLDHDHAGARALLGHVKHRGIWMRSWERQVAEGRVLHDGRWLSHSELQAVLAAEQAAAERQQERREALAQARESRRRQAQDQALLSAYSRFSSSEQRWYDPYAHRPAWNHPVCLPRRYPMHRPHSGGLSGQVQVSRPGWSLQVSW